MALNSKRLWNIIINQPLSASPTNVEILGLFKHVVIALGTQMAEPEIPKKREVEKAATKEPTGWLSREEIKIKIAEDYASGRFGKGRGIV